MRDVDIDGRIMLIWILRKYNVKVLSGTIWIRIGTSGGLL